MLDDHDVEEGVLDARDDDEARSPAAGGGLSCMPVEPFWVSFCLPCRPSRVETTGGDGPGNNKMEAADCSMGAPADADPLTGAGAREATSREG